MIIDFKGHRILIEDKIIYLTKTENNLLEIIYNNREQVTTYQDIADEIYQTKCDDSLKKSIRKSVSLLRKKVSKYIKIVTVRDIGYTIERS